MMTIFCNQDGDTRLCKWDDHDRVVNKLVFVLMIVLIRQLVMIILDYLFSKEMTTYQWYQYQIIVDQGTQIFSRGRGLATLHLVISVGMLVYGT